VPEASGRPGPSLVFALTVPMSVALYGGIPAEFVRHS